MTGLNHARFVASSGGACMAHTLRPSYPLEPNGAVTHDNVRVSLSRATTQKAIEPNRKVFQYIVAGVRGTADPPGSGRGSVST